MEDYKIFHIPSVNIYFFTKSNLSSRVKTAKTNAINEYLVSRGLTPTKVVIPHEFVENITSTRTGVINRIKELKPDYKPINKDLNKDKRNNFNNTHVIKCVICDKDIKYFSSRAHFKTKKHGLFSEAINNFNKEDFEKKIIKNEIGWFCICCNIHFKDNEKLKEHTETELHYRNYLNNVIKTPKSNKNEPEYYVETDEF